MNTLEKPIKIIIVLSIILLILVRIEKVKADTLYPDPGGYYLTLGGTNIITAPNKYFFQEPNVDTEISVKLQIGPGWTPEENPEAYSFLILPYCAEKNYKPSFNLTGTCNESCFSRNSIINYFTKETCNFKYGSYNITGKKGYLQLRINKSKDFGGGGIEVTDNLIILKNNEMSARWLVWFNNPFSSTIDIYSSLAQSQELNQDVISNQNQNTQDIINNDDGRRPGTIDQTQSNRVEDAENQLLDKVNLNSNFLIFNPNMACLGYIFDTMDDFVKTDTLIFGLFTILLSLGILAFFLRR